MADTVSGVGEIRDGVAAAGKWTNSLKDTVLDCPVEVVWDLFSDWGNWQRWYTAPSFIKHTAGEHRKPGCVRFLQYPNGMALYERALEVDEERRFFSYILDENNVCGQVKNFVSCVEFRGTAEGKTIIPFWDYEVDAVDNYTPATFAAFVESILGALVVELESAARRLAGLDPLPANCNVPTPTVAPESSSLMS